MSRFRAARAIVAAVLALVGVACSSNFDEVYTDRLGDPPATSATIGAAGGVVGEPNGAQVIVPAGALQQSVTVSVESGADGAPPLPAGITTASATFALTPHGTAFALPVTVRIPYDPAGLDADEAPTLWKTNAQQTGWEVVPGATVVTAGTVEAQITGFSWIVVPHRLRRPLIGVQPQPQAVVEPAAATFSVGATSLVSSGPLRFQWRRNGNAIPGANTATYTTGATTVAADDGAVYSVDVANDVGSTPSANATLTVTAVPLPPVTTTAQATGGYDITFLLSRSGQVTRIGGSAAALRVPLLDRVKSIAAGSRHLLMLRADGSVWAWGDNLQGQLGDGTRTPRDVPVRVLAPAAGVVAVAAGVFTSVALKADGTLLEWGVDPAAGSVFTGLRLTPVAVPGLTNVTAVAVAHGDPFVGHPSAIGHLLALRADGTVWAWGYNGDGALGDGTRTSRAAPAPVVGLADVTMITAGERFSIAVRRDDTVWGWGFGGEAAGVLPRFGAQASFLVPQLLDVSTLPVPGLADVAPAGPLTAIVAGHDHVVALRGGNAITWGFNLFGQLGIASAANAYGPAVTARPPNTVLAIGAGSDHSLAIDAAGDVWAWGRNALHQLGDGTTSQRQAPVRVPGVNLH